MALLKIVLFVRLFACLLISSIVCTDLIIHFATLLLLLLFLLVVVVVAVVAVVVVVIAVGVGFGLWADMGHG